MKNISPLLVLFMLINILLFAFPKFLVAKNIDQAFVLAANAILFLLSTFGFIIQKKGALSANLNAFLRGIYTSLLAKMFLIVAAILIYIVILGGNINKAAILISMALYILYTMIEVTQLMKLVRRKKNG